MNSRHPAKWQQCGMKGENRSLEERFTSNCCYLGSPPKSQNVTCAHPGCQTQLQIGERFGSPARPHQGELWRRSSVPQLCGRCSVSNHSGHMPTSFVIASSCKWWHTACIARCQWPSTLHWQLVGSKEAKESQFLNYLVVLNEGKGHPGVPTGKVNKSQHKKHTYCSCEQQWTQQTLWFEPPSPNPIKTNILVRVWRSHTTCSWTRGKQTPQWKGTPMLWQRWVPFQIERSHCLGKRKEICRIGPSQPVFLTRTEQGHI